MSFRSAGQSDARRRRVLIDDRAHSGDDASAHKRRKARPGGYSAAARLENQPRITDFIPTRHYTISLWLLAGLVCVASLQSLYAQWPSWKRSLGTAAAPFDLAARGSLASWFSAVTLAIAALLAVLIYSLRRHKEDDYRGRYRMWLLFAVLAILGSIDSVTQIHGAFARTMVLLTGREIGYQGSLWTAVVFGPLALWLLIRLVVEFWGCRRFLGIVAAATVLYGLAGGISLHYLEYADAVYRTMSWSTCLLLGHVAVAYTAAYYARHVFLDSQGRLVRQALRKKAKAAAVAASDADASNSSAEDDDEKSAQPSATIRKSDLSSTSRSAGPSPAISPSKLSSSSQRRDDDEDDQDDERTDQQRSGNSLQRFLSKSERKRLRRDQQTSSQPQRRAA